MTENPTPDDASEEAISAKDVLDYVVKQVQDKPVLLFVGGFTLLFVGRKMLKSSKSSVKEVEKLSTTGTVRLFRDNFNPDTYDLSVLIKGEELRRAVDNMALAQK